MISSLFVCALTDSAAAGKAPATIEAINTPDRTDLKSLLLKILFNFFIF